MAWEHLDLSEGRRRVIKFKRTQWNLSVDQIQFPQLSKNHTMIPNKCSHSNGNARWDREIQYKSAVKARAVALQNTSQFFVFFPLALTSLSLLPATYAFCLLKELPSERSLLVVTELFRISGTRRSEDRMLSVGWDRFISASNHIRAFLKLCLSEWFQSMQYKY